MILFHAGAVAALFAFSWKALVLAALLWWIAGSLGIGMGYHRLLTHRGYKTPKWMEYILAVCGTLALEGGPLLWVATHRVHLQKSLSDLDGTDPNIHAATVEGVMRELCNAFVRRGPQPGVPQMLRTYRQVRRETEAVMRVAGATNLFEARVFKDLCFVAHAIAQEAKA